MLTYSEIASLNTYAEQQFIKPVFICYRGSVAHNLYVPSTDPNSIDDIDVFMVTRQNLDVYVGLKGFKESRSGFISDRVDLEQHDIRKFLNLCYGSNPNVIQSLFIDPKHIIYVHPDFKSLVLDNRTMFSSKSLYKTFTGYAAGQLAKLTTGAYKGYMGEKRKELVDKFGYDCKNASHLIRLLMMAKEYFLNGGTLVVDRTKDRDYLLAIKQGKFPLNEILAVAEMLAYDAKEACENSTLPDTPDYWAINSICQRMILGSK